MERERGWLWTCSEALTGVTVARGERPLPARGGLAASQIGAS